MVEVLRIWIYLRRIRMKLRIRLDLRGSEVLRINVWFIG